MQCLNAQPLALLSFYWLTLLLQPPEWLLYKSLPPFPNHLYSCTHLTLPLRTSLPHHHHLIIMPLFPRLVGAVEIRERRPRDGEPYRYRKLEFVRPKTTTTTDSDWPLVITTYPRPQARQYGHPWEHPQWNSLPFHQQREILERLGYIRQPPPHFPPNGRDQVPAPPLVGERPPPAEGRPRPELPAAEVVHLSDVGSDSGGEGNDIVEIIEPRPRNRGRSRSRRAGHSIFGSDSEDDDRPRRRHSPVTSIFTISSDGSSSSRRGGRRPGHRGW